MTIKKIEAFFRTPDAVAARVPPRGWLSFGAERVPAGCFGYAVEDPQLGGSLLQSGSLLPAAGDFGAFLLRAGPWDLEFGFDDLASSEGLAMSIRFVARVEIEPSAVDVRLFLSFARIPERLRAVEVASRLAERLRSTFVRRLEELPVEEAAWEVDATRAREILREAGEEVFFDSGLQVRELRSVRIECPAYEKLRRGHAELQVEAERLKQRLRRIELWKKEQLERERALREVAAARAGGPSGPDAALGTAPDAGETTARTSRLLLCAGRHVLEIDPATDSPASRLASFEGGEFGHLRSVRLATTEPDGGAPLLLAGAQRGIYLVDLSEPGADPEAYPFPAGSTTGGGANAAILAGRRLHATHSDVGLVTWSRSRPDAPRVLFDVRQQNVPGVRAVQLGIDGLGYFAAGDRVLSFELDGSGRILETWGGAGQEITAFAAGLGEVVAGTRDGRLLTWKEPGASPSQLTKLGEQPISALRPVFHAGEVHYVVVAARSYALIVVNPRTGDDTSYRSPGPLRWADAAPDRLFAVDRSERRLYIWRWGDRQEPGREVAFRENVRDIWVETSSL